MDIRHVDCACTLRCWLSLGLRYILLPADSDVASKEAVAAPPSAAAVSSVHCEDLIQRARERLDPPHAQIWTYWELPLDLGEFPSHERRVLWLRMLKALALPPGCVLFWPMSLPGKTGPAPRVDLFWEGVKESGAQTVVCFGRRAFAHLFPDRDFSTASFFLEGRTIQPLPGPEDMLPDNREAKAVVWKRLLDLVNKSPLSS